MENLSSTLLNREALLVDLEHAGRAHSTATVMFHAAMAEHFGLSPTDWKCAGIIELEGPLTAGQLAELTGLTTGAITGLVDRLEKGGFVRRESDPHDRRRVIIRALPASYQARVDALFSSLLESFSQLTATYSDADLALILDFMKRSASVMQQETAKLRAQGRSR